MKINTFFSLSLILIVASCKSTQTASKPIEPQQVSVTSASKTSYWQQHVDYTMSIDMDVKNHQYKGSQKLVYTNNSPDVLNKVFYHLYFNAFQPGSEMDTRSLTIADPDKRVQDKISKLKPNEIGYIKVNSLKQDGVAINYETVGTVLEVDLIKPIQPGESVTLDMVFNAQVPLQIRRAGRDNKEGVAYSMTQWYPKLAEYDFEGWHAHPYIAREFHSVWGNFDVTINIDKNFVLGGTGYLQNPNEIGYGYETGTVSRPKGNTLKWHFKAPNVHDFTWGADPEFLHDKLKMPNGPTLHFLYKKTLDKNYLKNWKNLQSKTADIVNYFSEKIGKYPYKQYSVIQGGDGGMEYAMCTLITGERKFESLVGVTAHELAHTWFQFLLATNESKHEWMDEGFTTYISTYAMDSIFNKNNPFPLENTYGGYYYLVKSGKEQPQSTHADRYAHNFAYGISAYNKGAIFLEQLGYVIGSENLKKVLKKYFNDWAFKHPTPNDFLRVAEKVSGLELDWYLNDWTKTTNTIDYGVKSVIDDNGKTSVSLERIGLMPMPLDVEVEYNNGKKELFYIPLQMMRGEKPKISERTQLNDWAWTHPTYNFVINTPKSEIRSITIDPLNRMADIDKTNNKL